MKKVILYSILLLLLLPFGACTKCNYSESDFLGKTSTQIQLEFGEFDCVGKHPDEAGVYRNTSCGYTIRESRQGFLGTKPELLLFICFDENGVAYDCYEGYRPGG